jgi:hypothetical protein
MAGDTVVGVLRGKVAWRTVVVCLMTGKARRRSPGKFSSSVALNASDQPVGAEQSKARLRMIKRRGRPADGRVTCCAIVRQQTREMIW